MGELVYCSTPRRMKPHWSRIINEVAERGETPLFPFNAIPDDATPGMKKSIIRRFCYRLLESADKVAFYGLSDGTLDELKYAKIIGKPIEFRHHNYDSEANQLQLEAILNDRSQLLSIDELEQPSNGIKLPSLAYCATPTRMREQWKPVMESVLADGDCPLYPFNAIIEEHSAKLSREQLMSFDFRLVAKSDSLVLFGVSEGTLEELRLARHLGKPVALRYHEFDLEWEKEYTAVTQRRQELKVLD